MSKTSRRGLLIGLIVAAAAATVFVATLRGGAPEDELQRPAPALPQPTREEQVVFFYRAFTSGARTTLADQQVLLWRDFGERPLMELGRPALDYLLAEERYPAYRTSPNVLLGVLRFLPGVAGARDHERLDPFLTWWLDPAHCPPRTPGADWPLEIRRLVFDAFGAFPTPAAVPACLDELRRTRRDRDLRKVAMAVLIAVGEGAVLNELYETLPPNDEEEAPDLRTHLLQQLHAWAAPGREEAARARVLELEPVLQKGLRSERVAERLQAMGTLLRLGHADMAGRLIETFEQFAGEGHVHAAWSALLMLAQDQPHPYVRRVCFAQLAQPTHPVAFETAARLVSRWWPDAEPARSQLWAEIERRERLHPMQLLPDLVRVHRARVVDYLLREIRGADQERLEQAAAFAAGRRLREVGPALLERVREVERERRPVLYHALVTLRTPGVEALLLAEMADRGETLLRSAAATELLNLGGEAALLRLGEELEARDPVVLRALLTRSRAYPRTGVPDALVGPVFAALRRASGEDDRRVALFILRYRGTLDGVREGLIEAYRREPSRRVAREIGQVLLELAHR
ncbi:MAG: hypothetical protein ACYTEZ_16530 [Planctomycetota bacterium]|jgi:hypothetical protein